MQIEFLGPIYHTSQSAVNAFADIVNLIISSDNIMELNKKLLQRNQMGQLSAYFLWSFDNYTFSLWQRTSYGSDICFEHKLIELQFVTLVCKDRRKPNITTH
jgi:hypothetical protein